MKTNLLISTLLTASIAIPLIGRAGDTTPAQQLAQWSAQAGQSASAARGQTLFTQRQGGAVVLQLLSRIAAHRIR